jgi:sugar phosphate isomerase/epimerase
MNRFFLPLSLLLAAALSVSAQSPAPAKRDDAAAEKLGWHLATKAYTFIRYSTLFETIDASQALGVKYFEVNPGQTISKEIPDKVSEKLSPELRAAIKKKFADAGIQPVNFGVANLGKDEAAARKIFELCKDLGIQTIVAEPALEILKPEPEAIDLLDKLCDEYHMNVAIHNHPQPARFWNPSTVLEIIKGHSNRIGSCADVGHWTRSGLDTVDCLHQLAGHVITLHFKDVAEQKKDAKDVVWGTGKSNVAGMLDELHRQNFKGYFSMEYEVGKEIPLPDLIEQLRQSIVYFDGQAKRIASAAR